MGDRFTVESTLADSEIPLFVSFPNRERAEEFAAAATSLGRVVHAVEPAERMADWAAWVMGDPEDDVEADWIEADRLSIVWL